MTEVPLWLLAAVLALYGAQRLLELYLNRRNTRILEGRGGYLVEDDLYTPIVGLHVAFFVAVAAEWALSPFTFGLGWWTWIALAVFVVGQVLRFWSMVTLEERWTTRIVVVPGEAPVTDGPYASLDHPIYLGVSLELLAFPLMLGLPVTAVVAFLVNLPLIRTRIRREEAALEDAARRDRRPEQAEPATSGAPA